MTFKLNNRSYYVLMAEKILKENFSHRGWKDKYSFIRHKYFAEKIKEIDKLSGDLSQGMTQEVPK